jgi:hypothetical protein
MQYAFRMRPPVFLSYWTRLCQGYPPDSASEAKPFDASLTRGLLTIWVAGMLYGLTIGIGRSPLQALYTGIKFPLILTLTVFGNALLNAILIQLLGIPLSFSQALRLVVRCFALLCLILGSLCPVFLFIMLQLPDTSLPGHTAAYSGILLFHVIMIAMAGCTAHLRLFDQIRFYCHSRTRTLSVVVLWLGFNLLLGSQFSWNLRPFFGSPQLPVEFLRPNAFEKNFFEALSFHIENLIPPKETTPCL